MIKIDPYFKDEPKELWIEATRSPRQSDENLDRKSKIELVLIQKSKHKFDSKVYGLAVVKAKLHTVFHHKCAFCESTMKGALPDVEHFRFKTHYYWLGYEWTNLLLSCQICNRYCKGTHFPLLVDANRVQSPPFDSGTGAFDKAACHVRRLNKIEKPLLIHPAIDNPTKHIRFKSNGSIEGVTNRGKKSIEVYGLDSPRLIKDRETVILKIVKFIHDVYKMKLEELDEISKQIWMETIIKRVVDHLKSEIFSKSVKFIGFRQAILKDFEAFIIDNTNKEINDLLPDKDIMRQAVRVVIGQQL